MADAIYHFTWGTFCDWYVELVKGAFDDETKRVAAWAFDQILVMLHPFMPFVTEELWNANERPYELIVAKWPEPEAQVDTEATARDRMADRDHHRSSRRAHRAHVPWSAKLRPASPRTTMRAALAALRQNAALLDRMAKIEVGRPARCRAAGLGPDRGRRRRLCASARRHHRLERRESAALERLPKPPRRSATASPRGSPTPTSPNGPSPKRSKRPAPTMTRSPTRRSACGRERLLSRPGLEPRLRPE